ncbi:T9SS type A sorting domain-containing protein [Dyadobacter aurulentus]|uniref:T9SS type A sorting domain-containing protein n=1 Tax=Dyadobacter sp. UC 10 TaxID=2605428 RepID=UPI0038D49C53
MQMSTRKSSRFIIIATWILFLAAATTRLKMVDGDGTFAYSKISVVLLIGANTQAFLFPNPASNLLFIKAAYLRNLKSVRISGTDGKTIRHLQVGPVIDIQNLPNGRYVVELDFNGFFLAEHLLIVR